MNAIINARIYDYVTYIENGYLVYDDKIVEVGDMKNFKNKGYDKVSAADEQRSRCSADEFSS